MHAPDSGLSAGEFPTTHWSVILGSRQGSDRQASLNALFSQYWPVLYRYFRSLSGCDHHQAKDWVQDFLLFLLERDVLEVADPERGRFRTYLRTVARNFWIDRLKHEGAQKRGGSRIPLSLDLTEDPSWAPPAAGETPERAFDRDWARQVLERAVGETRAELRSLERLDAAEAFRLRYLEADGEQYEHIARRIGTSVTHVKNALTLAREVFRRRLRAIVREVVEGGGDVDPEVAEILDLAGKGLP